MGTPARPKAAGGKEPALDPAPRSTDIVNSPARFPGDCMQGWAQVCTVRQVFDGEMKPFARDGEALAFLGEQRLVISQHDGRYYAIEDRCGFRGCRLSRGQLRDHVITCEKDGTQYDSRNGKVIRERPAEEFLSKVLYGQQPRGRVAGEVLAFTMRMDGDAVYIKVDATGKPIPVNPPPQPPPPGASPPGTAPGAAAPAPSSG